MKIYGPTFSPFVRKVAVFAAEKGLAFDVVPMLPNSDDAAFRAASPFGKVPAISDGDFTLSDSSAIVHYLDAKQPANPLIPVEAQARGRTVWFDEFIDTLFHGVASKIVYNRIIAERLLGKPGDPELADAAEQNELPPLFDYLERNLPESGHFVEDRLTLADIVVASGLVNLGYAGVEIDAARFPRLAAFKATMLARPSFANLLPAERAMLKL